MLKISTRIFGKAIVDAKLLAAAPRILAQNKLMVKGLLDYIKPLVVAETPLGPGHFGYHLRNSFTTNVKSNGVVTTGTLSSPPTGYWREFGTLSNFNKGSRNVRSYVAAIGGFGSGGEKAHMTAHHTLAGARRLIQFYYGGLAAWWRA